MSGVEDGSDDRVAGHDPVDRARRADGWEAAADERERLADEREHVADEREWLADERDRLLDQRDHGLDNLERLRAGTAVDPAAQLASVREALLRAEPGPGRAEEELLRARQAGARAEARALRAMAAADRAVSAHHLDGAGDAEERAWLLDRRDFVAAERDRLADERELSADRRDDASDQREVLTDERDRTILDRAGHLQHSDGQGRRLGASRLTSEADQSGAAARRAEERDRRGRAAEQRRAAARQRRAAAAQWGPQAYGPRLVASFAELARHLFAADDPDAALAEVLDYAVAAMPACDGASLTLWRDGSVFDTLATNPAAAKLDHLQFLSGQGPAFHAMREGGPVRAADLIADPRWPALSVEAADLGVSEVLCYGLYAEGAGSGSPLGAFTLSSGRPGGFGEEDREFGAILAAYLAVAVATFQRGREIDRREAALHRALSSRDVIGQAKGILMERAGLSAPEAFDVLRRASQRLNLRITDLAEHLAQTGMLPDEQGEEHQPGRSEAPPATPAGHDSLSDVRPQPGRRGPQR